MGSKQKSVIMILRIIVIVICLFSQLSSFVFANDKNVNNDMFAFLSSNKSKTRSNNIIIDRIWDLKGKIYRLPKGSVLISKGGLIKNGTLVGDGTQIKNTEPIFLNVRIKGKWNVPYITTKLFDDLSYDNSLRDVIALTNPSVKNTVTIEDGNYKLSVRDSDATALLISDNTNLIINGNLTLLPNSLSKYVIMRIRGNNVKISGKGSLVGDRQKHLGIKGEWGFGINVTQSKNVSITGLTIRDCWGDCIYIGKKSENITINNVNLRNARRQGVSIISGNKIRIKNSVICDIAGIAPEFAIDIEPNKNDTVKDVVIDNVKIKDCRAGLCISASSKKHACISKVIVKNSTIQGVTAKIPIYIGGAQNVVIKNNKIWHSQKSNICQIRRNKNIFFHDNSFYPKEYVFDNIDGVSIKNNVIYGNRIAKEKSDVKSRNLIIKINKENKRISK